MLNDVRLDDLFAALESSVVHDRGVDGRLVSVEESRHNLSRYRPEHESVAGEARRVPEVLHVGLAEYRGGVRGHVVVAGPLAHDADVLRARQQLDDGARDACHRVYRRGVSEKRFVRGALTGDDRAVGALLDVVVSAEACLLYTSDAADE